MALPPLLAQLALALLPFAVSRMLALAGGWRVKAALGGTLAAIAFVVVAIVGLAPPLPTSGVWTVPALIGMPTAPLAGLAIVVTVGVAAWLTVAQIGTVHPRRDAVLSSLLLLAVAPCALLGNLAIIVAPIALLTLGVRPDRPRAANDNEPRAKAIAA